MKQIIVRHGDKDRIASLLSCSPQTVRLALIYAIDTDLAQRIRKEALRSGGAEVPRYKRTRKV